MNFQTSVEIINKQINQDQTGLMSKFFIKSVIQNLSHFIHVNGKKLYQSDSVIYIQNINQRNAIQKKILRRH